MCGTELTTDPKRAKANGTVPKPETERKRTEVNRPQGLWPLAIAQSYCAWPMAMAMDSPLQPEAILEIHRSHGPTHVRESLSKSY